MTTGIYEILNTANGKRYIGSAVNFTRRWRQHELALQKGTHHSVALQRAWNKYGAVAFKFLPILTCRRSLLLFYEQQLLDQVCPEYNIAPTAGSMLGFSPTPEQRQRNAIAQTGKKQSLETRQRKSIALSGRRLSEAHKAKIALAKLGRKLPSRSEAVQANQAFAQLGRKRGRYAASSGANISAAKRGIPWSRARRDAQTNSGGGI